MSEEIRNEEKREAATTESLFETRTTYTGAVMFEANFPLTRNVKIGIRVVFFSARSLLDKRFHRVWQTADRGYRLDVS